MGLTEFPYQSLELLIHVKLIFYGERKYALNSFMWIHSKLNLPGNESYTHKFP